MSMSTLGNQLAALSSAQKGFAHSTSRANNDGIGRGYHHSNRHGHAVVASGGGDSTSRRPSLLYGNAREAAEVTKESLWENAVSGLESLAAAAAANAASSNDADSEAAVTKLWKTREIIGPKGLLSKHHLDNFERGTATPQQNVQVDAAIETLMHLLMTMLTEHPPPSVVNNNESASVNEDDVNDNPILVSCLHILEYLLRQYSIHTRPTTASRLLQTLLPLQIAFPTAYPQLFGRALALVDLQSVPQWTFLRPYAARGAPPLTRGALAKFVARDEALVKIVANVGKIGMEICLSENKGRGRGRGSTTSANSRRGISTLLSFSASVLVEALHIQSSSTKEGFNSKGGGVKESFVRALLPLVLSACKSGSGSSTKGTTGKGTAGGYHCAEWKEWGRLLASTLASLCPLSEKVKNALCDAIAEGLPSPATSGEEDKEEDGEGFKEAVTNCKTAKEATKPVLSSADTDDANSAIMTLLSVLGSATNSSSSHDDSDDDDDDEAWECYLPMLPPSSKRRKKQTIVDYVGCDLPSSTYKRIIHKGNTVVPFSMGAICQSLLDADEEEEDDESTKHGGNVIVQERMAPLLASIVMHALKRLEKESEKILADATSKEEASSSTPSKSSKTKKKKKGPSKLDAKCKADKDVLLILRLTHQPELAPLWTAKRSAFVAAVTVHAITSYNKIYQALESKESASADDMILERYTSIIMALSSLNAAVYDRSVAYAIQTTLAKDSSSKKKEKKDKLTMSRLAKLLGRDDASFLKNIGDGIAGSNTDMEGSANGKGEDAVDVSSRLLPPRVALEHADARVRLDGIARLKASMENDGADGNVVDDMDGDLGRALLRRLVIDDDEKVAMAVGDVIAGALEKQCSVLARRGSGDAEDMEVDDDVDDNQHALFASLVEEELDTVAKEALRSLFCWTYIGNKGDVWSPPQKKKGRPSKKSKEGKEELVESPLLLCIRICGSVAKLILEKMEGLNDDDTIDMDDPLAKMFCGLFLSLGAHIRHDLADGVKASPSFEAASEEASKELLQLFSTRNEGAGYASTAELITTDSIVRQVLAHFFSRGASKEKMSGEVTVPSLLQARFLWLALSSYSDLMNTKTVSSDKSNLSMMMDLLLHQMQLYNKGSKKGGTFQSEVSFLGEACKVYLSSSAIITDRAEFERTIVDLASTSANVSYEAITMPIIASQLNPKTSKKHNAVPGGTVSALIHACLHPNASKEGVLRILAILSEGVKAHMDSKVARGCIIPTFALLSHSVREIRERTLELLEQYPSIVNNDDGNIMSDICSKVTDRSSPLRSSLVMDGANTLPQLLSQMALPSGMAPPNLASVQKFLIESCKSSALREENKDLFNISGCQAAAVILSSMEKAGEAAFPLSKRWEFAGKDILEALLNYESKHNCNDDEPLSLPSPLGQLRDTVLSMLKGVLVNEAQGGDDGFNIQISVGPSSTGRRMRSYSIGASDSFTTLVPYPEDMLQAILNALSPSRASSPISLSKHVVQLVISRQSWENGVFPKLSTKSKKDVASALLSLRTQENDELAGSALQSLPLKLPDFIHLLEEVDASKSEIDQAAVVFITDCIRGNLDVLGTSSTSNISNLSSKLFDQLLLLSSTKTCAIEGGDSGGRDYTRVSILQTLLAIHAQYKDQLSKAPGSSAGSSKHGSSSKRKRSRSHSDVGNLSKTLASQANLLVGLVGGNVSEIHALNSGSGRILVLSLLTSLCEESPSAVVTSLLPALMSLAGISPAAEGDDKTTNMKLDIKALGEALVAIVPAYCMHAPSANLSLFSLLERFVGMIIVPNSENGKLKYSLLDHLVDALKLLPTKESSSDAIASLAACVMAQQAFNIHKPNTTSSDSDSEMSDAATQNDSQTSLDLRVLSNTTSGIKIAVSLSMLQYAEKIMSYICGLSALSVANSSSSSTTKVDVLDVVGLALHGASKETRKITSASAYSTLSEAQQRSILFLAINLLQSVRNSLSTPAARRIVRKSKGDDADLCLRLWNELMQTHTNALRAQHVKLAGGHAMTSMEKRFWDVAPIATSDCLDSLQNLLPVPHFLASVSSILNDDEEDTASSSIHKKKIIRLLGDRVAEVIYDSPEASLFLEMVPDIVAQVNLDCLATGDGEDSLASIRRTVVMQQGALVAIESFVRSLYPSVESGKLTANAAAVFLPALTTIAKILDTTAASWIKANVNGGNGALSGAVDAQCQLLSSSSLCVSTLVTTLKARCLPQLPSIIKPLVTSLKSVNALMQESENKATSTGELLQLSILKTLQAIAETMPQFLLPYLPLLFSNGGLPSGALRQEHSIRNAVMSLETTLATKVQVRQLIPALSQALSKKLQAENGAKWDEACSIINLMSSSIESSQRSELSPIIGKVFNGLVMAYGYEGDDISRPKMLLNANRCLLSLVMKLSEAQLRPLYARLREWRGDIGDETEVSLVRRYSFWSLSAELSKSLRSIFLPCLTSVLTDVIDELEIAVSLLCKQSKKAEGSKRRRIEDTDRSVTDIDSVKPLQPLLLCLESALKADAHEGGDWTRGDDKQRYHMILNHLGKLLLAQIPKEVPLLSDLTPKEKNSTSGYQQLVQGVGTLEYGNVVGCLTSLAAAAGNEQLWKPLNFAVLEACGHKRSEVRKAGIRCLLSIIETIGEEYMVLLPECLPVISELLEDDDEIAAMAKECVRQGEELLGESLEDSLR